MYFTGNKLVELFSYMHCIPWTFTVEGHMTTEMSKAGESDIMCLEGVQSDVWFHQFGRIMS